MRGLDKAIDLLLISAGFAGAALVYTTFFRGGVSTFEMALGSGASVLVFWTAVEFRRADLEKAGLWVGFVERFCLGTGINLLLHAILTYAFYIRRTPFLIAAGGLFSAALLTLRARSTGQREQARKRFLLVGYDSIAEKIIDLLREPLIGVLTTNASLAPADIPRLGEVSDIESVLKQYRPTNIVVSMKDWARRISPSFLLNCRLSGISVEESPVVYERFFSRVCCERLQPVDLLLSSALRGDSRTMAIQAVYTNLIGLALLVIASPVMLIAGLAVAFASGPGPVFESFECAGFQYIPFRLLRFRTARLNDPGTLTGSGKIISRLRLANLPQLLNVVRGDMALVGPRPVRSEFARYLTDLMPFYSHRFSVRPGILGWAQMHAPKGGQVVDECRQIEYDLFYVKEGSLWMDAEIMLESPISGRTEPKSDRSGGG
ncbi:MAG TPA: sugar transferase [Bryobacteraceae bacterium]|jgi:lipopolysaccharide/colanic/teichoic acid biosynthesis glycosyltransferase|nr:sugar transferase [Bryobacteraceae bacterium]